jgi:hypothetical protein
MKMNDIVLWFSLLEAVDQLQAEGKEFKIIPDEVVGKWGSNEAQDRVNFIEEDDGFIIKINPKEEM